MAYFYLNNKKEPQGPHTEKELRAMMQEGVLTGETMAVVEGDSQWRPLNELLGSVEGMPPIPQPELKCPSCHQELRLEENDLPASCPHCGRALRPKKKAFGPTFG